jgi:peptidoglycan hydrolase-like protein with peptidoglycan-binding domain
MSTTWPSLDSAGFDSPFSEGGDESALYTFEPPGESPFQEVGWSGMREAEAALTEAVAVGDRIVVQRHPLLTSHRGTSPDLIIRWNRITGSGPVDVVVHFHGYSGRGSGMRIDRDKEPRSGLDLSGRARPTVALLPRGNFFGGASGNGYNFPALTRPRALSTLIQDGLGRASRALGVELTPGRLILTGHSGGGAPVTSIVAHTDPDEVHIFDGTYGSAAAVAAWARGRIERYQASPTGTPPAMRIIYRTGTGTQRHAESVARELRGRLAGSPLVRSFRVEATRVAHNDIPSRFGPTLLADPTGDLPDVRAASETSAAEAVVTGDALAWLDSSTQMPDAHEQGAGEGWSGEGWPGEGSSAEDVAEVAAEAGWSSESGVAAELAGGDWSLAGAWSETAETRASELLSELPSIWASGEVGDEVAGAEATETGEGPSGEERDLELDPETGEGPTEEEWTSLVADASTESTLQALLDAESGLIGGLADRVKGVTAFVFGGTLRQGDSGAAVAALQRALTGLGFDVAVDGAFGPNTERAVRSLQAARGIAENGVVGPLTKAAIAASLGSGPQSGPATGAPASTPVPPSAGADRAAGVVRQSPASPTCAGDWQPGARALAGQWSRLTGRKAGGYVCRPIRGSTRPSVHGDGRAVDAYANAQDATQRAQADAYAAWLIANAVELQCAYIIWNGRQWSWPRRAEGWRPYSGVSAHTDHLHIELSWEGSRQPSVLFNGGVPGLGSGSIPAPPAPVPVPVPSSPSSRRSGATDASDLSDAFFVAVKSVSAAIGATPEDLLGVMMSESGVNPWAQNPHGKATGLIQFMPKILVGMGWTAGPDAFKALTAEAQMPYVQRYFAPWKKYGLGSAGRLYQATFLPGTLRNGSAETTVICGVNGPLAWAYKANPGLDMDKDGRITVGDLTARVASVQRGPRWNAILARLRAV